MNRDLHADPLDELRALTTRMRAILDDAHARYPEVPTPPRADASTFTDVEGAAPRTGGDAYQPLDTSDEPAAAAPSEPEGTPRFLDEEGDENALPLEFATATMGHVLLGQGRPDEARAIFRAVLSRDPDDAEAKRGLASLGGPDAVSSAADAPTESPVEMLDREDPPEGYGAITVRALAVDPTTITAFWEVPEGSREDAPLTLCVVSFRAGARGVERVERHIHGIAPVGERFVYELSAGAEHHVAIGFARDGAFTPIAHAPVVRSPRGAPSDRVARARASASVKGEPTATESETPVASPTDVAAAEVFDAARRAWTEQGYGPSSSQG